MASRRGAADAEERQDAGYREFVRAPAAGLDGLVASAVGYRSEGMRPVLHRGLPSPHLTLIFSLDSPVVGGRTPAQAQGPDAQRAGIVVGGLHQIPAYIAQPERDSGIQFSLHPLAARSLLGVPASELTGELIIPGSEVLGARGVQTLEQLCEQARWEDRFATAAAYLRRRAADADRGAVVRPEVAEAWAWLARRRGAGTLRGLSAHVALGPRRLTALFRAETGVTPKQAARLMRFQHATEAVVRTVSAGRRPDLARVAADCGYFDHSHLVRDFRQYTGLSPTAWIDEECGNIQAGGHRNGREWDA